MKIEKKKHVESFSQRVGQKEKQKLKAEHKNPGTIWTGLAMFGMVGWSIAIPTLAGAALGLWLDKKFPEKFSWTLTLLILGLITGCLIAWSWVAEESKEDKDE